MRRQLRFPFKLRGLRPQDRSANTDTPALSHPHGRTVRVSVRGLSAGRCLTQVLLSPLPFVCLRSPQAARAGRAPAEKASHFSLPRTAATLRRHALSLPLEKCVRHLWRQPFLGVLCDCYF